MSKAVAEVPKSPQVEIEAAATTTAVLVEQ
jgi:hypothetical protein